MKDKIIDEKVVIDINTPEGRKFYEDMESGNYILFSGGRAKGKTYTVKRLQALEIITKKKVDIEYFYSSIDVQSYNYLMQPRRKLTQEEFDLLKKVLI